MAIQIQLRRGTATEWATANTVLALAEMGIETDTRLFKIGDGSSHWTDLAYGGIKGDVGAASTVAGSKGDKGEIGVKGDKGTDGSKGEKGDTGTTGSKGDTGTTGSKGDKGDTGSKGDKGDTGSKGEAGYIGADGTKGEKGDKGVDGTAGTKGDQGSFGGATFYYDFSTNTANTDPTTGKLKFDNASPSLAAKLWIDTTDSSTPGIDVTSYLQTIDDSTSAIKGHFRIAELANNANYAIFAITGNHAEYAMPGGWFEVPVAYVSGSAGTFTNAMEMIITFARTGDAGDKGQKGEIGNTGSTGSKGDKGDKGEVGTTGSTGSKGDKGDTGTTGAKGDTGTAGAKGDTGTTGAKGDKGDTGTSGAKGDAGALGAVDITFDSYVGNGSNTAYTLSTTPVGENYTIVVIDGITQLRSDYSVVGTTLTFSSAVPSGALIEVSTLAGGAKGDKGEASTIKGDKGEAGYIGADGAKGDKGDTGAAGTTGTNGTKGDKGDVGPIGGANTQVVFNDSATANGASTLTFDKASNAFGAPNTTITGYANVSSTLQVTGITTLSANIVLGTTTITANGGVGSAGAVLTSGATGNVYWAAASGGGATLTANSTDTQTFYLPMANATSGSWSNAVVSSTKLYFVPSTGTLNSTIFNSLSDETQKTNKERIVDALSKLKQLGGYTYMLIDSNEPSAGLLAQQVQRVLPEAITFDPTTGLLRLNYNAVMGLVVESINELETRVAKLESNE